MRRVALLVLSSSCTAPSSAARAFFFWAGAHFECHSAKLFQYWISGLCILGECEIFKLTSASPSPSGVAYYSNELERVETHSRRIMESRLEPHIFAKADYLFVLLLRILDLRPDVNLIDAPM